jgi:hypothetical protein
MGPSYYPAVAVLRVLRAVLSALCGSSFSLELSPNFGYVTTGPPPSGHYQVAFLIGNWNSMATEPTTRKDNLKVEKLSLLVLALCMVILIYVLVRTF